MRNIALLVLALTVGCASPSKPPVAVAPAPAPPPALAEPARPPEKENPAPSTSAAPPPRAPATAAPAPVAPSRPAPATAAPAPAAHAPASATATPATAAPAAKVEAAAHLDIKGLERRLRSTSAIGVFTKLALKNQVDDLLTKFRAYHGGQQPPTLTDLRPNYELLIMKVQSLIQRDDPSLANDVARSRETIWGVLADKTSFASI
jgi:hypothetical protein